MYIVPGAGAAEAACVSIGTSTPAKARADVAATRRAAFLTFDLPSSL
jgi:hypothetical protein